MGKTPRGHPMMDLDDAVEALREIWQRMPPTGPCISLPDFTRVEKWSESERTAVEDFIKLVMLGERPE